MAIDIDALLAYEKYIPVLTDEEQTRLLTSRPTLAQLQEWDERLQGRTTEIDNIFNKSYNKSLHHVNSNGKRTR